MAVQMGVADGQFGLENLATVPALKIVDERPRVRRRGEDVDVGEYLVETAIAAHPDEASHQVDDDLGPLGLQGSEGRQATIRPVLGALTDDARVQNDDVGVLGASARLIPQSLERRGDALRVGDVHLTAFGPDVVPRHAGIITAGGRAGRTVEYHRSGS